MKYLRVKVTSPYINTERSEIFEVDDDFDPDGENLGEAIEYANDVVNNYVESWWDLVDADDLDEDERIDMGLPLDDEFDVVVDEDGCEAEALYEDDGDGCETEIL